MGYHNHFWEFRDQPNGTKGLDILIAFTEPELVDFELDLYWIEKSGLSPQSYFEKYPNRFSMWHVKDMDKANRAQNTEIGNGTIDWKRIFKAAKTSGMKHFFVEQENNYVPDHLESIKRSIGYIKGSLI